MAHSRTGLRFNSIMNKYGLRVRKINACRSLYRNAAGYRITTSKGSFFLKPYHGRNARLDAVYHQMIWLRKHQFQSMPLWLRTVKGTHWAKGAGRYYYVTEWIQGTHLSTNEQDYEHLGGVLAQLHLVPVRTIRKQPEMYTRKEIHRFKQQHRLFARRLPKLQKKGSEIGRWFRNYGDICVSLAQEAWKRLGRPYSADAAQRESFVHSRRCDET